jgi:hypothetical protein
LAPEHEAQILGYLKSARFQHGLLINFGSYKFEMRKFIWEEGGNHKEHKDHKERGLGFAWHGSGVSRGSLKGRRPCGTISHKDHKDHIEGKAWFFHPALCAL